MNYLRLSRLLQWHTRYASCIFKNPEKVSLHDSSWKNLVLLRFSNTYRLRRKGFLFTCTRGTYYQMIQVDLNGINSQLDVHYYITRNYINSTIITTQTLDVLISLCVTVYSILASFFLFSIVQTLEFRDRKIPIGSTVDSSFGRSKKLNWPEEMEKSYTTSSAYIYKKKYVVWCF